MKLIYALKCPFTEEVHYIGKSTKGMLRPLEHLSSSHSDKIKEWVDNLKELGHAPKVEIIENVSNLDNLDNRERYWISYCIKKGCLLLNTVLVSPELVNSKLDKLLTSNGYSDIRHISTFIKERRKISNITQEDFADKSGVALTVLRKIEQGKTNVTLSGVLQILSMFGCTLEVKKLK